MMEHAELRMLPDDFIPHHACWHCQRDLDALPWTAQWIGSDLHPVCEPCRKAHHE